MKINCRNVGWMKVLRSGLFPPLTTRGPHAGGPPLFLGKRHTVCVFVSQKNPKNF